MTPDLRAEMPMTNASLRSRIAELEALVNLRAEIMDELNSLNRWTVTDLEGAHRRADELLCKLLVALGYADIVAAWGEVGRWYA